MVRRKIIKGFATEKAVAELNIPKVAKKIISKEKPAGLRSTGFLFDSAAQGRGAIDRLSIVTPG
jgi:hypothetical protein